MTIRLEPVALALPEGFDDLRAEARAERHRFPDRLAEDWATAAMRFDRPGEACLAARSDGALAAVGGITIDPVVPGALRMRRFYVRPAFRGRGIGHRLAMALLAEPRAAGRPVMVNAARDSVRFWEALGFTPDARDGHTHRLG